MNLPQHEPEAFQSMSFLHCARGEFSDSNGCCPESSWHQLRWDPQHTQVESSSASATDCPPTQLMHMALKVTGTSEPKCCIIHIFLSVFLQFHTSNTFTSSSCSIRRQHPGCVMSGELYVCVLSSPLSPEWACSMCLSFVSSGTLTEPNRFAAMLSSTRIPTTDWCVSWRRKCLAWKISSMPRAWVT